MTNAAPPGWYTHPSDPNTEHWWDGTAYVQSRPKMAPPPPAPMPPTYAPTPPSAQVPAVYPSSSPPAAYAAPGAVAAYHPGGVSPKSRTVASILGFFLGGLGVDRFYLGNVGLGVTKLLVGWLTLGIWPLVDWIIILSGAAHDGDGLPVTNWN